MFQTPFIAILLTCHNRKDKTIQCLEHLFAQLGMNIDFKVDVFLVDDGSVDGTTEAVVHQFPQVNVIAGHGNLFWNQGMRLAWQTAAETNDFDFYLWLNDDTILDSNAISILLSEYKETIQSVHKEIIITSSCRAYSNNDTFSYGGRTDSGPVIPSGKPQKCTYINGNAVLVPKVIFKQLGNLSKDYTHGMGDFDYGLRALKAGFNCYTTSAYIATCQLNSGIPGWCNPDLPLKKRWDLFHSPRGLNIKEYIIFRKKFWGTQWVIFAIKAYIKMVIPQFYQRLAS